MKKALTEVLKDTISEALPKYPFHIIEKEIDSLTKAATFTLKAKKKSSAILTTKEIIADDSYLIGLSKKDREIVEAQYRTELSQPVAYIEEYPIAANEDNELIFKIMLIDEGKIVCGSASYFIKKIRLSFLSSSTRI